MVLAIRVYSKEERQVLMIIEVQTCNTVQKARLILFFSLFDFHFLSPSFTHSQSRTFSSLFFDGVFFVLFLDGGTLFMFSFAWQPLVFPSVKVNVQLSQVGCGGENTLAVEPTIQSQDTAEDCTAAPDAKINYKEGSDKGKSCSCF